MFCVFSLEKMQQLEHHDLQKGDVMGILYEFAGETWSFHRTFDSRHWQLKIWAVSTKAPPAATRFQCFASVAASELDHPEPLEAVTASEVLNALGFAG